MYWLATLVDSTITIIHKMKRSSIDVGNNNQRIPKFNHKEDTKQMRKLLRWMDHFVHRMRYWEHITELLPWIEKWQYYMITDEGLPNSHGNRLYHTKPLFAASVFYEMRAASLTVFIRIGKCNPLDTFLPSLSCFGSCHKVRTHFRR